MTIEGFVWEHALNTTADVPVSADNGLFLLRLLVGVFNCRDGNANEVWLRVSVCRSHLQLWDQAPSTLSCDTDLITAPQTDSRTNKISQSYLILRQSYVTDSLAQLDMSTGLQTVCPLKGKLYYSLKELDWKQKIVLLRSVQNPLKETHVRLITFVSHEK